MTRKGFCVALVGLSAGALIGTSNWPTRAQTPPAEAGKADGPVPEAPRIVEVARVPPPESSPAKVPVAAALDRPITLPFKAGTSLESLAEHLSGELGAPVVLDVAALNRLKITPESSVRLQLEGVRLRTGLKLLLGQVGLTFRVVPEDNLLVLTDPIGAEDPAERSIEELKALRHEVADLKILVEDIYDVLAPREVVPSTRNPTIIEEMPVEPKPKPDEPSRSRPG